MEESKMEKISIENLSINIKKNGQTFKIMDNQSLEIRPGDVILISGPNGSGKSSVIKTIVGDLLDFSGLSYTGKLCFYERNNDYFLIDENQKNRRLFLSRCSYVSQNDDTPFVEVLDSILASLDSFSIENKLRYVFDFIYNNSLFQSYFSEDEDIKISKKASKLLKQLFIEEPTKEQAKTAVFLTMKSTHMSGGQKKLLNIIANLIKYDFCDICIIDEPINNLDYSNVRLFANLLQSIHTKKPSLSFLIVSHCRSIPIINRIVQIRNKQFYEVEDVKTAMPSGCSSCFGPIVDGRYI